MAIGDKHIHTGRYWNANDYAVAIVAVITEEIDWAAYIGGADSRVPVSEAIAFVADYGSKLARQDAEYFFPGIDLPYRL